MVATRQVICVHKVVQARSKKLLKELLCPSKIIRVDSTCSVRRTRRVAYVAIGEICWRASYEYASTQSSTCKTSDVLFINQISKTVLQLVLVVLVIHGDLIRWLGDLVYRFGLLVREDGSLRQRGRQKLAAAAERLIPQGRCSRDHLELG